ncbi:nucleoside recognition domain-containing protein [Parabacteroides sp. FAFU027]|uniref:nucleoside recognition domain-containing protein n=1 Tax=Parabacteroides sp. FAFU027 TaxID=2922715 RepID=UPI001FAFAB7A|nr:nucleoside recognition domain-containing protein [Parabacteroides sp. FAFU027]
MALNYIFIAFILIAFVVALIKALVWGDLNAFYEVMLSTFDTSKTAFEVSLGLTGALSLWMGLMKIGEHGGLIKFFSKLISPLFVRLFPDIPKEHPAIGSIFMNVSANLLGLGNAATPLGLKAMKEMQELNKDKETASNPMIMFLVLNTSGLTLVPVSIMVLRAQMGAANASDVFLPILLATFFSTIIGILSVAILQRINILDKVILAYLGGLTAIVATIIWFFSHLPQEKISLYSNFGASFALLSIIVGFLVAGMRKKVNVYNSFIEGAKEGFQTAVMIIPYLVAILVAVGMFRASGAMGMMITAIKMGFDTIGVNSQFVDALPTALMKPLSGSGARGMMVDAIKTFGPDSIIGRMVSVIQGAADTTFYILAVYFGSVGVKNTRYAVGVGLLTDLAGIVAAILLTYLFFGH